MFWNFIRLKVFLKIRSIIYVEMTLLPHNEKYVVTIKNKEEKAMENKKSYESPVVELKLIDEKDVLTASLTPWDTSEEF